MYGSALAVAGNIPRIAVRRSQRGADKTDSAVPDPGAALVIWRPRRGCRAETGSSAEWCLGRASGFQLRP